MSDNRYWLKEVADARELVEHSKGVDYAFVGVLRAQAILAVDEELRHLREITAHVGTTNIQNQ